MSSRGRIALTVLPVVALIAVFWFGLLAPKRAQTSAVEAKIAQAETRRAAALAVVGQAGPARAEYQRDYQIVARLGKAVPSDDDVASLVYQLDALARANKIDFRAVKLTAAAAGAPAPAAPPPPAKAGAEGSKDKPAEQPAGAAPVAPVVAQPPPGAVVGTAGLLTMPFSFTFDGGYLEMQRFLGAIDDLAKNHKGHITVRGRLITVDGFSLAAGRDGFPKVKALVSATAYLAPDAPAATAAAPAAAPGAPAANPIAGAPAPTGAAG